MVQKLVLSKWFKLEKVSNEKFEEFDGWSVGMRACVCVLARSAPIDLTSMLLVGSVDWGEFPSN